MEKGASSCTINTKCTGFSCSGVVDPRNDPPTVADHTYKFLPCDSPPSFSMLALVSSLSEPVIDIVIDESAVIDFNPSFLGTINITLVPTDTGVKFGVSVGIQNGLHRCMNSLQCQIYRGAPHGFK